MYVFVNFCLNEEIVLLGKRMDNHKVAEKSIEDNEVHWLGLIGHLYIISRIRSLYNRFDIQNYIPCYEIDKNDIQHLSQTVI